MLQIKNYDAIIFDFGGVIININYQLSVLAFEQLGFTGFHNWYSQAAQHTLFDLLEVGKISDLDFYDEVRKISKLDLTNEQIEWAWNALLLNLPIERLQLLEQLKTTHRIFLLSNTNAIHTASFSSEIDKFYGWKNFTNLFEKAYLSHEIGMRKPNAEIFEYVINQNGLDKNKTLFIDDSIQHIEGAKQVGIHTHFLNLKEGQTILKLFSNG